MFLIFLKDTAKHTQKNLTFYDPKKADKIYFIFE